MIKVNIEALLKKNNCTKYWLCNQMNITSHNLNQIILGATKSISFRYIEDFCKYLKCTPSELFTIETDKSDINS
jgi:DNA-binding Xre family transcriptional regulator